MILKYDWLVLCLLGKYLLVQSKLAREVYIAVPFLPRSKPFLLMFRFISIHF